MILTTSPKEIQLYDLAIDKKDKMLEDGFSLSPVDTAKVEGGRMVHRSAQRLSLSRCLDKVTPLTLNFFLKIGAVVYGMHHSAEVYVTKVFQSDFAYHLAVLELADPRIRNSD